MNNVERSAAFEWGFEKGEQAERGLIITLLEAELNNCKCESPLQHLIALIKGENK